MRKELIIGQGVALAHDDVDLDLFVTDRVRHPDSSGFKDSWVLVDHTLDFRGRDVLAGPLDHVLDPIVEQQVTIVVEANHVAGAKPTTLHGGSRRLRIAVILGHSGDPRYTGDPEFPTPVGSRLGAIFAKNTNAVRNDGQTQRHTLSTAIQRIHCDRGHCFRHSVPLQQWTAESFFELVQLGLGEVLREKHSP